MPRISRCLKCRDLQSSAGESTSSFSWRDARKQTITLKVGIYNVHIKIDYLAAVSKQEITPTNLRYNVLGLMGNKYLKSVHQE